MTRTQLGIRYGLLAGAFEFSEFYGLRGKPSLHKLVDERCLGEGLGPLLTFAVLPVVCSNPVASSAFCLERMLLLRGRFPARDFLEVIRELSLHGLSELSPPQNVQRHHSELEYRGTKVQS